jgi:outer membrane protein OmpA-like peptidoglycan-associated protein
MRASRMHRSAAFVLAVGGALLTACSGLPAQPDDARARAPLATAAQAEAAELQADITNRGLVLTLGDVLFGGNTGTLNTGGSHRLDKVVDFLNRYPQRTAVIEGYDDSMGSHQHNRALLERRTDAVKTYLVRNGISSERLTVTGDDAGSPIGDNGSAADLQNRHVEVVIRARR